MPQMSPMMWDAFVLVNVINLLVLLIFFNFYMFDVNFKKKDFLNKENMLKVFYKW